MMAERKEPNSSCIKGTVIVPVEIPAPPGVSIVRVVDAQVLHPNM